jgi:uncharacterized protein YndB with AHSA1/START domain
MAKKKKPVAKNKVASKKAKNTVKKKATKPAPKAVKKTAAKSKKLISIKKAKTAKPKKIAPKKIVKNKKTEVKKQVAKPIIKTEMRLVTIKPAKPEVKKMVVKKMEAPVLTPKQLKKIAKSEAAAKYAAEQALIEPKKRVVIKFSKEVKSDKVTPPHPNQFSVEYIVHASQGLIFEMVSDPSSLSEWFADDVHIKEGYFTFFWDGSSQTAKMLAIKENKFVRFQWTDKPTYTFFEFKIETDELTNEVSLIVTDFAEDGDQESARMLWDKQIGSLKKLIGA